MSRSYKPSPSGYYKVELNRPFPRRGFSYKPGLVHTVNQEVLDLMAAEPGLIISVTPA